MCPECNKCDKQVEYRLIEVDGRSEITFNFGFMLAREATVRSRSFYISKNTLDKIVKASSARPGEARQNAQNHYYVSRSDSPLFIGNHRVVNTVSSAKPVELNSVEDFERHIGTVMKFTASAKMSMSRTSQPQPVPSPQNSRDTACSSAEIVVIDLSRQDFKYVIDARLPPRLRLVVLGPDRCPSPGLSVVRVLRLGKYFGLIALPSLFQNVLFSALNHVDVMGLVYYLQAQTDPFLANLIELLSQLSCENSLLLTSSRASFESNQRVLDWLGVQTQAPGSTGWDTPSNCRQAAGLRRFDDDPQPSPQRQGTLRLCGPHLGRGSHRPRSVRCLRPVSRLRRAGTQSHHQHQEPVPGSVRQAGVLLRAEVLEGGDAVAVFQ